MNKIFFKHPSSENTFKQLLLDDIKQASKKVLCAMAYFTDIEIKDTIINSTANDVRIILNNADFYRNGNNIAKELFKKCNCMRLGTKYNESSMVYMHNKLLICDNVLWTGFYNFTIQANTNNWETILRIDEPSIVEAAKTEFEELWFYSEIIETRTSNRRCPFCHDIVILDDSSSVIGVCPECALGMIKHNRDIFKSQFDDDYQ